MSTPVILAVALLTLSAEMPDASGIKITDQRGTDSIEIIQEQGATIFVVTSRNGIGSATIQADKAWPMKAIVRLKYDGDRPWRHLEGFSVANKRATVSTFLGGGIEVRATGDQPVEEKIDMRVNAHGAAMDVQLPISWLAEEEKFTIRWVDHYRN